MSYNDEFSEMVRNFAKLHSERDSALQELALANSEIKRLQAENEELKKRQITKNGFICDCKQNVKYKQALEDIREIIDFRFRTAYMTFGFKEYDKLIEDIDKITNEVLK